MSETAAELRLRLRGMPEIFGQLNALKQREAELNKQWTAIAKDGVAPFVVTLKQARALSEMLGGDTQKLATYLKMAGVSARDTKILIGQVGKELDESRKKALGVAEATEKAKKHGKDFAAALKDGVFSGEMLLRTLDAVKDKMDQLAKMAGMKGLEESTEDSFKLEANFNALRDSMHLNNTELEQYKKNVAEVSQITGIPQEKLTEAAIEVQEKTDKGRDLFLDNNGRLGMTLAQNTVANRAEGNTPGAFLAGINSMQDLGISEKDLPKALGIIRVGEQKGAIGAKNLLVELGGLVAQLSQKRGTSELGAITEGSALMQAMASAPGFKGKDQLSEVKVVVQNLLGKLANPEYQTRLQAAGIKTSTIDPVTKRAKLRPIGDLMDDIVKAQDSGKIKATGEGSLETIFKDQEARRAVQALTFRKTENGKTSTPALSLLHELDKATPEEGMGYLREAYQNRLGDRDYYKNLVNARNMAKHYADFNERADRINYVGEAKAGFEADHPMMSWAAEPAINLLGQIPKYGKYIVPAAYGALAGTAALDLKAGGRANAHQQSMSFDRSVRTGEFAAEDKERDENLSEMVKTLGNISKTLNTAATRLDKNDTHFTIQMGPDGAYGVTSSKTSSKRAARGEAARKPKAGQG